MEVSSTISLVLWPMLLNFIKKLKFPNPLEWASAPSTAMVYRLPGGAKHTLRYTIATPMIGR